MAFSEIHLNFSQHKLTHYIIAQPHFISDNVNKYMFTAASAPPDTSQASSYGRNLNKERARCNRYLKNLR